MDLKEIDLYLSRIISGYYIFTYKTDNYKLIYPNIDLKYESALYAKQEYDNNKFNNWINDNDIINILISTNLWDINGDNRLKNLEKQIEDLKVDLYKSNLNPTKNKEIRRNLKNVVSLYNRLSNIRHSLDHFTFDYYLDSLKNQYLLIHSIYYKDDNKKIFLDTNNVDYLLLNNISNIISNNTINIKEYREIARSTLWNNYWSANNNSLFDKSAMHWTDEQKLLVMFTKMYDSAKEHPECPSDKIFEDDDMFDGWMISQRRENEKIKNKNRAEKILEGKNLKNANEVFLMAESQEEAQNIYDLNDNTSRVIIKERHSIIQNAQNQIDDSNLPDVQRKIMFQTINKK